MMQNTGATSRHNQFSSSGSNRRYLPFGTYEKRRNFRQHGIIALAFVLFIAGFGYYWLSIRLPAARTASDPLVNTYCGDDGHSFGHIVGYLDGVAAYSNCNDYVASGAFALFRPNGDHCATIEADGRITRTSIGERLLQRWKRFHDKKHRIGGSHHGAHGEKSVDEIQNMEDHETGVPVGITAAQPSDDEYICGVQTGMLWQCVEFARRYWFVTRRCIFGSVEGAEDIFRLKTAEVLSDDVDGGKKIIGYRHLESHRNGGSVLPQKGDALIWRRQKDMPYGHVGIIAGVDYIKDEKAHRNHDDDHNHLLVNFDAIRLEVAQSFEKAAVLKGGQQAVTQPPPPQESSNEEADHQSVGSLSSAAAELLRTSVPIAFVNVADQNYHSKSWGGKSHHRYHILLKSETHVGAERYHLIDPEGYSVLGWVRLGELIEDEERKQQK